MSNLSGTPLQNPAIRRFSQVYVEIPPSPLHKSRSVSTSGALHVSAISANKKENTPLRPSNMIQIQTTAFASPLNRKRKLSESLTNMAAGGVPSSSKKPKLVTDTKDMDKPKPKGSALQVRMATSNATEEFPNGFFYCHQCSKKRDSASKGIYVPYIL